MGKVSKISPFVIKKVIDFTCVPKYSTWNITSQNYRALPSS